MKTKFYAFFLLMVLSVFGVSAKTQKVVNVVFNDGTATKTYARANVDKITFSTTTEGKLVNITFRDDTEKVSFDRSKVQEITFETVAVTSVTIGDMTFVDMGLSVWFATTNLGADAYNHSGDYYAWGMTEVSKNEAGSLYYHKDSYTWYDKSTSAWTKYTTANATLENTDDVAYVKSNGLYRIPTYDEWAELAATYTNKVDHPNYSWVWTESSDATELGGYTVTFKTTNQSIYLPACGLRQDLNVNYLNQVGRYWSNSIEGTNTNNGYNFYSDQKGVSAKNGAGRFVGIQIRPVAVVE